MIDGLTIKASGPLPDPAVGVYRADEDAGRDFIFRSDE
jgi:hypothetical protein